MIRPEGEKRGQGQRRLKDTKSTRRPRSEENHGLAVANLFHRSRPCRSGSAVRLEWEVSDGASTRSRGGRGGRRGSELPARLGNIRFLARSMMKRNQASC